MNDQTILNDINEMTVNKTWIEMYAKTQRSIIQRYACDMSKHIDCPLGLIINIVGRTLCFFLFGG